MPVNILLIGNAVCFVGALFMVSVGFLKQRRKILLAQSVQFAIMGAGNLILGGISGFLSNALGIVRNLFCLKRELTLPLALGFVAVQAALTFAADSMGPIGFLPVVAALIFTLTINSKNEVVLKAAIIVGQLCWAGYDGTLHNYASLFFDLLTVGSNVVGIFMLRRGKGKESER